jgi:nucleoside-diphosphate-sugar epimerase
LVWQEQTARGTASPNCSQKPYTIIRPCPIYGPGDRDFLELAKICKKGYIVKLGFKEKYSNMIHISELAELIHLCLDNPKAHSQIFFAADGKTYAQTEISRAMTDALGVKAFTMVIPKPVAILAFLIGDIAGKILGKPLVVNREKMKEFMADAWLCSIDKSKQLLGYNPNPDLNKHIKETIEWYRKASWL